MEYPSSLLNSCFRPFSMRMLCLSIISWIFFILLKAIIGFPLYFCSYLSSVRWYVVANGIQFTLEDSFKFNRYFLRKWVRVAYFFDFACKSYAIFFLFSRYWTNCFYLQSLAVGNTIFKGFWSVGILFDDIS